MHTETDEEVRMYNILKERMTTAPQWRPGAQVFTNYKPERGSLGDYAKMKNDTAEFKQALRRQLSTIDYNALYSRVEEHCRSYRPFSGKPYRDWLGVLTAVWSRALAGELPPRPNAFHGSGVQFQNLPKLLAVAEETKVKTKQQKPIKMPKPPKQTHNVIGVRFVRGHNVQKVYSYTVPKKVKLHLGEEVVVPSHFEGYETNAVAVVVALNHVPEYPGTLKQVFGRIQTVKA